MASRKKPPAPDDAELFRKALGDVAPLKKKPKPRISKTPAPDQPSIVKPTAASRPPRRTSTSPPPAKPPASPPEPPLALGATAGVDRRTAERFRRGRMAIDGKIDLHGMYQQEAHAALTAFIARAAAGGKRCVLVVTGKGRLSEGGGVLRRAVPQWLSQPGLREHILSVAQARPEHGGEGAMYVLLRKRRG